MKFACSYIKIVNKVFGFAREIREKYMAILSFTPARRIDVK